MVIRQRFPPTVAATDPILSGLILLAMYLLNIIGEVITRACEELEVESAMVQLLGVLSWVSSRSLAKVYFAGAASVTTVGYWC